MRADGSGRAYTTPKVDAALFVLSKSTVDLREVLWVSHEVLRYQAVDVDAPLPAVDGGGRARIGGLPGPQYATLHGSPAW